MGREVSRVVGVLTVCRSQCRLCGRAMPLILALPRLPNLVLVRALVRLQACVTGG